MVWIVGLGRTGLVSRVGRGGTGTVSRTRKGRAWLVARVRLGLSGWVGEVWLVSMGGVRADAEWHVDTVWNGLARLAGLARPRLVGTAGSGAARQG